MVFYTSEYCCRYRLHIDGYSGDVWDSLTATNPPNRDINGMAFSTFDSDHDMEVGL